tara:strand:- start:2454 stop:3215 length:762 start_codon:yes stop_codon:yes gene_type:complete
MDIVILTNGHDLHKHLIKNLENTNLNVVVFKERLKPILISEKLKKLSVKYIYKFIKSNFIQIIEFLLDKIEFFFLKKKVLIRNEKIDLIEVENSFNSTQFLEKISFIKPKLIILAGCRILKGEILKSSKLGIINAHPGKIPDFRGSDVVLWAISKNKDVFVTVHLIDHQLDAGVILESKKVNYKRCKTYNELSFVINKISAELLIKNSIQLLNNRSNKNIVNISKGSIHKKMNFLDKFRIRINFLLKKYDQDF